MKIVKYLLIILLTFVWVLFLTLTPAKAANFLLAQSVLTLIYALLIYLVWPIGTKNSVVGFSRVYIVFGVGAFLVALDVLMDGQYPTFPAIQAPIKSSGIAAGITFACMQLGKAPTALLISFLGLRLIYMGFTKKPEPYLKKPLFKQSPKAD